MSTDRHDEPGAADEVEVMASEPTSTVTDAEPPVVARLVVEIRSDGRRTIARGALEDRIEDQQVAVEIDTGSPLSLAVSLARALAAVPGLVRQRVGNSARKSRRRSLLSRRSDE